MPFTAWYGMLWQSLRDGTPQQVTAIDGNPYTVNLVTLINKLGVGTSGKSINPNDFELTGKILDSAVTLSAISPLPPAATTLIGSNASFVFNQSGSFSIAEIAVYADTIDGSSAHHQVMIRRDLLTPPFVTQPSTNYTINQQMQVSLLV